MINDIATRSIKNAIVLTYSGPKNRQFIHEAPALFKVTVSSMVQTTQTNRQKVGLISFSWQIVFQRSDLSDFVRFNLISHVMKC